MGLVLKNICKSFDNETVLDNISLDIKSGERIALMGPSGRGKTTLANIIMGLVKPDSGELIMPKNTRFSAVFQEDRLIEGLDAAKNIELILDDIPASADASISKKDYIKRELSLVGLENDEKKALEQSGGMKRRIAIVRAMLSPSDILILDEPFKGLDEDLKIKVMDYVKSRINERSFILITHDKSEAEFFSARIISLGTT